MAVIDPIKTMNETREEITKCIDLCNKALKENSLTEFHKAETRLKEEENEFKEAMILQTMFECRQKENPIYAGILKHSISVITHKAERDKGILLSVHEDVGTVQLDILRLTKYCNLPHSWEYEVEVFAQLLTMRAATELGLSKDKIKAISKSYLMTKTAEALEKGETPTSNTKICAMLQSIIDKILFVPDEKGKNIYRAANRDAAYLVACITKRAKTLLSVTVSKPAFVRNLIYDIIHRIITNKSYDVEYQQKKNNDTVAADIIIPTGATEEVSEEISDDSEVSAEG